MYFYRDLSFMSIGGGTDEITLSIICRYMEILPTKWYISPLPWKLRQQEHGLYCTLKTENWQLSLNEETQKSRFYLQFTSPHSSAPLKNWEVVREDSIVPVLHVLPFNLVWHLKLKSCWVYTWSEGLVKPTCVLSELTGHPGILSRTKTGSLSAV